MWVTICITAVVVVALATIVVTRRRARRPARRRFADLSRDDQVQAMRNVQGGDGHRGARDSAGAAGSGHLGEKLGP